MIAEMRRNEQFSQLDVFKLDIELFNPSAEKLGKLFQAFPVNGDETRKSAAEI